MITLTISNVLTIEGLPEAYSSHLKKTLTLENPLYYKLMNKSGQRARAFYGTPKHFIYFKQVGEKLVVPRGMRSRLVEFLEKVGAEYNIKEQFVCKQLSDS